MSRALVHCKALDSITSDEAATVGSKAYQCAYLKRAGLPVPDGFVVLDGGVDSSAWRTELFTHLDRLNAPYGFAVRSSGSDEDSPQASFAGIHETWLHVAPDRVAEAITACRQSMRSPRAQ